MTHPAIRFNGFLDILSKAGRAPAIDFPALASADVSVWRALVRSDELQESSSAKARQKITTTIPANSLRDKCGPEQDQSRRQLIH
jgi:hypothetical protein